MKQIKILIFLVLLAPIVSWGQTNHSNTKKGLAIDGYDPVSYFSNKPQEGKSSISSKIDGVIYYFINAENKRKFDANPEKYIPQYGGWCAYAMGLDGSKVKIDPETYKITNGKLYLFYNFAFTNTLDDWNKDERELAIKADKYWNQLVKE